MTSSTTQQADEITQLQEIFATLRLQLRAAELRLQTLNRTQDTNRDTSHPDATGLPGTATEPPRDRNGLLLHTGDKVKFSATKVTGQGTGTISRFASNNTRVFIIRDDDGREIQRAPHNVQLLSGR